MTRKDEAAYEKMIIIQILSEVEQLFKQIRLKLKRIEKLMPTNNEKLKI